MENFAVETNNSKTIVASYNKYLLVTQALWKPWVSYDTAGLSWDPLV